MKFKNKEIVKNRSSKNRVIIEVTIIIPEFWLPLMHFALSIRRTAGGWFHKRRLRTGNVREKGQNLLGGNSQGWESLNRPLAMVESFPFEMY
jgi:hypothetical protein